MGVAGRLFMTEGIAALPPEDQSAIREKVENFSEGKMIVGYARTSTIDQVAGFEAQLKEFAAAGCQKTYQQQVSSVAEPRQLRAAVEYVREGDIFVVSKLDRLARSISILMTTLDSLEKNGVGVRILNLGMDTQTPTGKRFCRDKDV
jgi:DNA invertase Pin-like site-specific DNA recombinase